MSASACYTLECDAPGCDSFFISTTDDLGEARSQAREEGWTYNYEADEDDCPDHLQGA